MEARQVCNKEKRSVKLKLLCFLFSFHCLCCKFFRSFFLNEKVEFKKIMCSFNLEPPEFIIYPRDEVITGEDNTLICFINHFFPPSINIKWTKNDVEVTMEDPFIKTLSNPDGTAYVLSYFNFVPEKGDIYSCTVEHELLDEPQTKFWGENKEASDILAHILRFNV